jgi:hypothetical protein
MHLLERAARVHQYIELQYLPGRIVSRHEFERGDLGGYVPNYCFCCGEALRGVSYKHRGSPGLIQFCCRCVDMITDSTSTMEEASDGR